MLPTWFSSAELCQLGCELLVQKSLEENRTVFYPESPLAYEIIEERLNFTDSQGLHNNRTSVKREKVNWKTAGHWPLKSVLGQICACPKYMGGKSPVFVKWNN